MLYGLSENKGKGKATYIEAHLTYTKRTKHTGNAFLTCLRRAPDVYVEFYIFINTPGARFGI